MNEFDNWRSRYDSMTYDEQVAYHNSIEDRYPEQAHYNYPNVRASIMEAGYSVDILEFGCWKADMAAEALTEFPAIKSWTGIEICQAAIEKTRCKDKRFEYIFPEMFDWFNVMDRPTCDLILATHFIEHLSNAHFEQLVTFCKGVPYIYFEAPLSEGDQDWTGYIGTHKLGYGWMNVCRVMAQQGFGVHITMHQGILFKSV